MADDTLLPEGEAEGNVAPPENEAPAPDLNGDDRAEGGDTPPDPIEELAKELRWVPRDQFRGNPEDWKPADEFIRAGRDIQQKVSRELKEVRATVENMSRTSAAVLEQQLAQKKEELEARYTEAVEAGDPNAARQIDRKIASLEAQAPAYTGPPTDEGQRFAERNASWYGKDQEATRYAVVRAQHYADQGVVNPARQLAAVEKDMRELFPELFPKPAKPAPSVAQPTSRTATTSARKKSLHDLPAEAQAVARDMVERGVIPNTDIYVTNYFNQPERKVG